MLVRFLFAAVLLAGCSAPVIQPSPSHSAVCQPGCQAVRTHSPGQREPAPDPLAEWGFGSAGTIGPDPWDADWANQLPGGKAGLIAFVIIVVVLAVATTTLWR
jgi:hypothetical protein